MPKTTDLLNTIDSMFSESARHGLMLRTVESEMLDGRHIRLGDREVINFGSCSYLGLEMDTRLRDGVIDAVMRYGTQFSSSRSYLSAPAYDELESLLGELFGGHVIVVPTTTLGHQAVLPVVIEDEDAIILDHSVHHSVSIAARQVQARGVHLEVVRHNRMDLLERRVAHLQAKHRRVWYLADGVYSMFADTAPLGAIEELMERFPSLHLYIDDSHGVGWTGRHGRGYVLEQMPIRPRMIVAASLNKSFASAGGALIFPDEETKRRVRTCGGSLIFSGPVQPPMLGAAIASARLHLSDEIHTMQAELAERIRLFNRLSQEAGLPLVANDETPIRYIGTGLPGTMYKLAEGLLADGYFTNQGIYPAVPMRKSGIRITITRHQTETDIRGLVAAIARRLPEVLAAENSSLAAVRKAFELPEPAAEPSRQTERPMTLTVQLAPPALHLEHTTTCEALDADEWDALLGARGTFDVRGLRALERAFGQQSDPTQRWAFHYFVVRDADRVPVLATFFTEALWKDDMTASARVSERIEVLRESEPRFLTSRVLAMGSLLTEGDHLYLDTTRAWRGALNLLFQELERTRERAGAETLMLRDLANLEADVESFFLARGFSKLPMPESLVLDLDGRDENALYESLSKPFRRHHRQEIWPHQDAYEVEALSCATRTPSAQELEHFYALYRNVHARSYTLNTFALPETIFADLWASSGWELLVFRPRGAGAETPPVGVVACYVGGDHYVPMVVGLDYAYVNEQGLYRQALRQVMCRASALGRSRVLYGMGASLEKRRFGARPEERFAYVQSSDLFNSEVLAHFVETAGLA